jgi:RNA polymerase sigma-70 factor (ECF subfamily)
MTPSPAASGSASADDDRRDVQDFLRSRGEPAFLRLYDRHTDALYRFAARLVGTGAGAGAAEAAEIVQETWLRALDRLATFRGESSLRTWLCGIALNRWRELRERAGRERAFALVEGGRAASRDETRAAGPPDRAALALELERAIEALPEGYREVLLLHDLEGYTHEEIARHFGIAEGTSKSQLHRARKALRDALTERGVAHHG